MMDLRRKIAAAMTAAVLSFGFAATPAVAAANGDYTANGVNIRNATGVKGSVVVGAGYKGQGATIYCALWNYHENSGDWWYHQNKKTRVKGYSLQWYMKAYTSRSIHQCRW